MSTTSPLALFLLRQKELAKFVQLLPAKIADRKWLEVVAEGQEEGVDSVRFLIATPVSRVKILGIPTVVRALQDIAGADAQPLLAVAKIEVAADAGVEVKALRVSCTIANAEVEEGRRVAAYQVVNLGPEMGKDGDYT